MAECINAKLRDIHNCIGRPTRYVIARSRLSPSERATRHNNWHSVWPCFIVQRLCVMAYIRCQNHIILLTILLCDIDITFCNMHGLFCYVVSHYAMFIYGCELWTQISKKKWQCWNQLIVFVWSTCKVFINELERIRFMHVRLAFHWRGCGPHGRVKEWCAVSAHHSLTQPCGPKPRQWKAGLRLP